MCKNDIIQELYTSREFNECIGKMEPEHLRDDLKAEVVLILLEMEEKKIQKLHERKELKFFTVRIILNLIQSKTSFFFKQYRQQYKEVSERHAYEEGDITDREEKEGIEDRALCEVDNLYWYNKEMVLLYLKHGNYRAIEEKTRIPYSSAYKTIQKSLQEIKQKVLK